MKWISLVAGLLFVVVAWFAFPSSPSAPGSGLMILGLLLMADSAWAMGAVTLSAGLDSHKDEIEADFYDIEHAKWRYLLAIAIAGANGGALSFSDSNEFQTWVSVGGFSLFGAFGFASAFRARQRASGGHRHP